MTDHRGVERVGAVFDDWAERGRGEGMETGHRPTADPVLRAMDVGPGDAFLDLGTGIGWAARDAAARGARAVGVDAAGGMLRRARDATAPDAPVDFVRASFEHLPFKEDAFSAAFSMEALYYAPDLDAALEEARRVMAPGGALHALVDFYAENVASHDWPEKTGVPMHLLPEAEWVERLEAAGFVDADRERVRATAGETDEAWKVEHGSLHVRGRAPR